jgi:hypothetical protein
MKKAERESEKSLLISELDDSKLLEISLKIAGDDYQAMTVNLTNGSAILNPNSRNQLLIVGFDGLKSAYDNCSHGFYGYMSQIRQQWQKLEHLSRASGKNPERTIKEACNVPSDTIAELAIYANVRLKEARKLQQKISEIEESQKQSVQRRCLYRGSVQRARKDSNGVMQISRVDGMAVNEKGVIEEMSITVEEYLEVCKEKRQKRRIAA